MKGGFIELLASIARGDSDVVRLGDEAYGVRGDGFVAIAWCRDDAEEILAGVLPDGTRIIDISEDTMIPSVRSASVDVDGVALEFDGDPILVRFAQWGGHGGMPPGAGGGIGGGFGTSSPMATPGNFENFMARQQFDVSLDSVRHPLPENGWNRSMEDRLQSDPMYGHQRNERDKNLVPYTKTFEERVKMKKVAYLERLRKFRAERTKPKPNPNSVASIKAMPVDPRHSQTTENRLSDHRQNDDDNFRPGYHGPESQFVYFPPPPVRTAAKIEHRGLTSVFDYPGGDGSSEAPNPFPVRPGVRPDSPGRSSMQGLERGLQSVRPNDSEGGFLDPQVMHPLPYEDLGPGGTERANTMPYSMRGPQNSGHDFELLHRTYRNGYPDEYHVPLVMNQWPSYSNPGEQDVSSTVDDERNGVGRMPQDEQRRILELMRKHRFEEEQPRPSTDQSGQTTERRLAPRWRRPQTGAVAPNAYDYQGPAWPWGTQNSWGIAGLGRASRSRGY